MIAAVAARGNASSGDAALQQLKAEYLPPEDVPYPSDNRHTAGRERLGRTLFFDPRLSESGWISCATCHNPGFSWGDGLPRAVGHGDDTVTHHIYSSTKGQEFNLDTATPGRDVRHTFTKRGRVDIRCGLHPGMRLVVTVN